MPWWNWKVIQRNGWKVIKRLVENRQTRVFTTFKQRQPTKFVEQTSDKGCMTIIFLTKRAARRWTRSSCWISLAVYRSHAAAVKAITSEALTDTKFYYQWGEKNLYNGSVVRVNASYRPSSKVVGCGGRVWEGGCAPSPGKNILRCHRYVPIIALVCYTGTVVTLSVIKCTANFLVMTHYCSVL